mmetsp:Transcript_100372/g.259228  ORF Transcript_100372/g.259228 Transcript_100372/m.259228 type:complete len:144 (+) Transcript_100372:1-432(+)
MKIMLMELLVVRKQELERVLEEELERALTPERVLLDADTELGHYKRLVKDLGDKLKAHYKRLLTPKHFKSRASFFWTQLDISLDGMVTRGEFERRASEVLLPTKELQMEANFYEECTKAMNRARKEDGQRQEAEHHEGGCVQQ